MRALSQSATTLLLAMTVIAHAEDGRSLVLDAGGVPGSLTISAPTVPIAIESRLVIEKAGPSGWEPQRVRFSALARCSTFEPPLPPCINILPNLPLTTVAWRGQLCADQCYSHCRNPLINQGHYRFVAKACDGTQGFRSGVFTIGVPPALSDSDAGIEPLR